MELSTVHTYNIANNDESQGKASFINTTDYHMRKKERKKKRKKERKKERGKSIKISG